MSATKEHYHDRIEEGIRIASQSPEQTIEFMYTGQKLREMEYWHNRNRQAAKLPKYDILELTALNMAQLIEIASALGMVVGDAKGRQTLMYAILEKQAEITPRPKGGRSNKICNTEGSL
jgi:hypothetical protein